MKKGPLIVRSVLGTLGALLLAALVFVFSGVYDVAADAPHTGLTRWALHTVMDRSVEVRAASVDGTAPTDDGSLRRGFGEYDEMCVTCHGAPGVQPRAVGRGLDPEPPDLAARDAETDAAELFWVIDHGVKFTGMPGFGATHSDETVWAIVAFVKKLPGMSPEEYARWREESGDRAERGPEGAQPERAEEHEHGGEHAHGGEGGDTARTF